VLVEAAVGADAVTEGDVKVEVRNQEIGVQEKCSSKVNQYPPFIADKIPFLKK
jgi:hypothetical protein